MKKKVFTLSLISYLLLFTIGQSFGQFVQKTDLPTLYINTLNGAPIESNEVYLSGTLTTVPSSAIGAYTGAIEIRGRGNITWDLPYDAWYPKRPYRIKLATKSNLLGMTAKEKSWTLLANHGDKTMIRNALAFRLSKLMGFEYTVDYRFVDLVLNNTYVGTYQLADQVQVAPKRVPVTEIPATTTSGDDLTGGYFLEADAYYDKEAAGSKFATKRGMYMVIKSPDSDVINTQQREYISNYFMTVENAIFSEDFKDPSKGYQKYLDMTSLVNWYLACEITGNPDAFRSIYMYKKKNDPKIYFGPIWDNDLSWNNDNSIWPDPTIRRTIDFAHRNDQPGQERVCNAWIDRILTDPAFNFAVRKRIKELFAQKIPTSLYTSVIDELAGSLSLSQKQNFLKWDVLTKNAGFSTCFAPTYEDHITDLKIKVERRVRWLGFNLGVSVFEEASNLTAHAKPTNGIVLGSPGAWDKTSTKYNVFDGENTTFFDAPTGDNQWVGMQLEGNKNITCIKFRPREGAEKRMRGGKFQIASNPEFTDFHTIYTIPENADLSFKDYYIKCAVPTGVLAKYIRYLSPKDGYGNIAEMTVYEYVDPGFVSATACSGESIQAIGTVIGTPGSWDGVSTGQKAFDGNINTYFDGPKADNQWTGMDLGSNQAITCIKFRPRNGAEGRIKGGKFQISSNADFTDSLTIYTIPANSNPSFKDYFITSKITSGVPARFIRYLSPDNGFGNIAEITVYSLPGSGFKAASTCGNPATAITMTRLPSNGNPDAAIGGVSTTTNPVNFYYTPNTPTGGFVDFSLNGEKVITCITYKPRPSNENRLRGGRFEIASNPNFYDAVTIYTIPLNASISYLDYGITAQNPNGVPARYIRYVGGPDSYGSIGEFTVYGKNGSARIGTAEEAASDEEPPFETKNLDKPVLYPNPVRDVFTLGQSGETIKSLKLYNTQGQQVQPRKVDGTRIDISNLPFGSYILNVNDRHTYHIQKID